MFWPQSCHYCLTISLLAVYYATISLSNVNAHGGAGHGGPPSGESFHDTKFVHDAEHLKEHLQDVVKVDEEMSPEEMEFNYFKLHDIDNNTMLDGLEILRAIEHALDHQVNEEDKSLSPEEKQKKSAERLGQYTDIIDKVFKDDDADNDGYLSYFEYVVARKRDEDHPKKSEKK